MGSRRWRLALGSGLERRVGLAGCVTAACHPWCSGGQVRDRSRVGRRSDRRWSDGASPYRCCFDSVGYRRCASSNGRPSSRGFIEFLAPPVGGDREPPGCLPQSRRGSGYRSPRPGFVRVPWDLFPRLPR